MKNQMVISNSKKVSFIIAAYNEEKFIEQCINSCLNQTYGNIEVCITDDGSIDNTWDILQKYNSNSKVKTQRFELNLGKVAAFNKSFEMADGEFIAIMGGDDVCEIDRIEISISKLSNHGLVFGDLRQIDESGKLITAKVMKARHNVSETSIIDFDRLLRAPCVFGGTILCRRDLLNDVFPLNKSFGHEDWWIPLVISKNSTVRYIDHVMISYRLHSGQSSGPKSTNRLKFEDWRYFYIRNKSYYLAILKNFNLSKLQKKYVRYKLDQIKVYESNFIIRPLMIIKFLFYYRKLPAAQLLAAFHPKLHFLAARIRAKFQ